MQKIHDAISKLQMNMECSTTFHSPSSFTSQPAGYSLLILFLLLY